MTPTKAKELVGRGAALLDERRPGWANAIDTGLLDMSCDCSCVLGQLEGSYNEAAKNWWPMVKRYGPFGLRKETHGNNGTASRYGFYSLHSGLYKEYEYDLLQEAWIEAIAERVIPVHDDTETDLFVPGFRMVNCQGTTI